MKTIPYKNESMLKMIESILRTNQRGVSVTYLAQRYRCTGRTIYRYLNEISIRLRTQQGCGELVGVFGEKGVFKIEAGRRK